MKHTPTVAILTLALLTAPALAGGVLAESNAEQTGQTAVCTQWPADTVARNPNVMALRRDGPGSVEVDPGTEYEVSVEGGIHDRVTVDFFDQDGNRLLDNGHTVPADAAWGKVCAWTLVGFWEASTPASTFTYQDGL